MQPLTNGQTGDVISALFFFALGAVGIALGLFSILRRDRAIEVYNWIEARRFTSRLRTRTRSYALAMGIGLIVWGLAVGFVGVLIA